ncbi:MAG: hypothetical protein ACQEQ8_09235 [Pseudomonadota bacterium]
MFLKRFYERNKFLIYIILAFVPSVLMALGIYWLISAIFFDEGEGWGWGTIGWVFLIFIGFWFVAAIANADKIFFGGKR